MQTDSIWVVFPFEFPTEDLHQILSVREPRHVIHEFKLCGEYSAGLECKCVLFSVLWYYTVG